MESSLLGTSSEESFEQVDPDFDNSYYPELRGIAVADYIPLEKDEIMIRKGIRQLLPEQLGC